MKQCPKCSGSIRRMGHIEKPFYCPKCKEWFSNEEVTPKLTNADRIRSMTDEELAKIMEMMAHGDCGSCEIYDYCFSQKGIECPEAWLNWLKKIYEH